MADTFKANEKASLKRFLFETGVKALERQGWTVERIQGTHKSSVRRLVKGSKSVKVSIRTSQDTWIAFPRNRQDNGWRTLSEVDAVIAVAVDSPHEPKFAQVHWLDGEDVRQRFERAYRARIAAGREIPRGRGMWVSLYREEATQPAVNVGAGAGLANPAMARIALTPGAGWDDDAPTEASGATGVPQSPLAPPAQDDESPLTIADAKRRLARFLGVDPSAIKITVEA